MSYVGVECGDVCGDCSKVICCCIVRELGEIPMFFTWKSQSFASPTKGRKVVVDFKGTLNIQKPDVRKTKARTIITCLFFQNYERQTL